MTGTGNAQLRVVESAGHARRALEALPVPGSRAAAAG
jgi:hypothetical protein